MFEIIFKNPNFVIFKFTKHVSNHKLMHVNGDGISKA
jgi:hypothetical protein